MNINKKSSIPVLIALILALAITFIALGHAFAQQNTDNTAGIDTSRYFPDPQDFGISGWQVNFQHFNQESRVFASSSNRGYRMLVDMNSAPKTALTFNVTIALLRPGTIRDKKRGMEVSNAHFVFRQLFDMCTMGHYMPAKISQFGDESLEAAKDYDKYRIIIRRGQYIVDIVGTDNLPARTDKPSLQAASHFFAHFIDSRIFGARVGLFKPIQVLDDPRVPMVAGKRIVIYSSVEVEKDVKLPAHFNLTLNVRNQGFRQSSYAIPLGVEGKTVFGPAGPDDDGSLWSEEYGEPVELTPENRAFFKITDNPKYSTYLFRYFLDPAKSNRYGNYIFGINIIAPSGSKLKEQVYKRPVFSTRKLRIAIIPLPVGYWAPGKDWKIEDWLWLSKLGDQAWKRQSYIGFVASLPEDMRMNYAPKKVADFLRKRLLTSKGQRSYNEKTKEAREFLMGTFPVAEENFEIYISEEFPEDLKIEPHPTEVRNICLALDKWLEKHPRFDRIIGVVPGGTPLKGGVGFYLDDDAGRQFWYRKKSAVVSIDAPTFQFAHELARTFGAVDEFMEAGTEKPSSGYSLPPINRAVGMEGGNLITNGYWPAKIEFMGTPLKSINSIMGKREPAWITKDVYNGILKQLVQ